MIFATLIIVTLVTALMMFALKPLALELHFVDSPGGRKRHVGEVPVIGGVAMFIGVAIGIALLPSSSGEVWLLLVAGGLLVAVGIIDDRFELPASVRLIAQLAAVLIMVFGAGLMMRDIGDPLWIGRILLGPFALVTTILIFASVINAYNMSDGLDGLCGSMVLVSLVAIAFVSAAGSMTRALALTVSAAIIGFLLFNLPIGRRRPFRAFMGDAGSTFLGLSVVWLMVGICQGPERVISPVHGLWFAAVPIFDLFTCFVLRAASGRSPFSSGRDHFHHVLREKGMSVRSSVATLVGLQALYASFGIVSHYAGTPESLLFTLWALLGFGQRRVVQAIGSIYARVHNIQSAQR